VDAKRVSKLQMPIYDQDLGYSLLSQRIAGASQCIARQVAHFPTATAVLHILLTINVPE
jgi:hypothetical protein